MLQPINEGLNNLLKLATELERVHKLYTKNDVNAGYLQSTFFHPCGTPACALGHWANLIGDEIYLHYLSDDRTFLAGLYVSDDGEYRPFGFYMIQMAYKTFHLLPGEYSELFSHNGCGGAQTADEAAAYIRKFIARKIEALTK